MSAAQQAITKVVTRLTSMSAEGSAAVYGVLSIWGVEVSNAIKSNLARGVGGVRSRSGAMSRAVTSRASRSGDVSTVSIGVFDGIPQAAALEFGSRAHVIYASSAKALRFKPEGSSRYLYRRFVNHPGTRAYAFISGPAKDMLPGMVARLQAVGVMVRGNA